MLHPPSPTLSLPFPLSLPFLKRLPTFTLTSPPFRLGLSLRSVLPSAITDVLMLRHLCAFLLIKHFGSLLTFYVFFVIEPIHASENHNTGRLKAPSDRLRTYAVRLLWESTVHRGASRPAHCLRMGGQDQRSVGGSRADKRFNLELGGKGLCIYVAVDFMY